MFYIPNERNHGLPHDPFQALVAPRPIGWISTCSLTGVLNLAPYSYFNALSSDPWLVAFSASSEKDSVAFARESGEFVANFVSADMLGPMVQSSVNAPRGTSEFDYADLTAEPSTLVRPPRVREACAALECKVTDIWRPSSSLNPDGVPFVVVGEVVGVFIRDDVMTDGLVDIAKTRPVSRLGYLDYAITESSFRMIRPRWNTEPER
jgi:flavin reductase (DIM6/NTAB) family NADH-FMN oxidoreductase RutF